MPTIAPKHEPKNPARVDAALKQHLRRMDGEVRFRTGVTITFAIAFVLLLQFPFMRPKATALMASCAAVIAMIAGLTALDARIRGTKTRGKLLRSCRSCGYDLRATPDACPECGAAIPDELRQSREAGKDKLYVPKQPTKPGP
ncbi:MAG: hypothetical protein WBD40_15735 [Tepidisphaeraceae bacterium]